MYSPLLPKRVTADMLTIRECEIVCRAEDGHTPGQMAEAMDVLPATIYSCLSNMRKELGFRPYWCPNVNRPRRKDD